MIEHPNQYIKHVQVTKLFGRYSYNIPHSGESLKEINILYGENGLGKTTLLSLIFHLLSPSEKRSHRTAISNIPFFELQIIMADGTKISAKKDIQLLVGPVAFSITRDDHTVSWNFTPNVNKAIDLESIPLNIDLATVPAELRGEIENSLAQKKFHQELAALDVVTYMLTADRLLLGDAAESEREIKRKIVSDGSNRRITEIMSEQRNASVEAALEAASSWLQSKFFERSYGAGQSASRVYQEVVARIVKTQYKTSAGLSFTHQAKTRSELITKINSINSRGNDLAKVGLPKTEVARDIVSTIENANGNKLNLIASVLKPHLDELEARLQNIEPFLKITDSFTSSLNGFLRDKELSYNVRSGLKIRASDGSLDEISPSQLSSGEKQLVLMFCHVITARERKNIFIIDEPEISLNITWQRMLVDSLKKLTKDSNTQFLFASHSMEILAKHRNRVVTLEES